MWIFTCDLQLIWPSYSPRGPPLGAHNPVWLPPVDKNNHYLTHILDGTNKRAPWLSLILNETVCVGAAPDFQQWVASLVAACLINADTQRLMKHWVTHCRCNYRRALCTHRQYSWRCDVRSCRRKGACDWSARWRCRQKWVRSWERKENAQNISLTCWSMWAMRQRELVFWFMWAMQQGHSRWDTQCTYARWQTKTFKLLSLFDWEHVKRFSRVSQWQIHLLENKRTRSHFTYIYVLKLMPALLDLWSCSHNCGLELVSRSKVNCCSHDSQPKHTGGDVMMDFTADQGHKVKLKCLCIYIYVILVGRCC